MHKSYLIAAVFAIIGVLILYDPQEFQPEVNSFEQFKSEYHKYYARKGEEEYRKVIFMKNLAKFEEHNANPTHTYRLGVNQFADMS